VPLDAAATGEGKRFDFLAGLIAVPDDFDTMGTDEVEQMFGGGN
jgi:hypothetical protein